MLPEVAPSAGDWPLDEATPTPDDPWEVPVTTPAKKTKKARKKVYSSWE